MKDIEGQRFAADGSPLGSQFLIDTYETGDQLDPEVAIDAAGDFELAVDPELNTVYFTFGNVRAGSSQNGAPIITVWKFLAP